MWSFIELILLTGLLFGILLCGETETVGEEYCDCTLSVWMERQQCKGVLPMHVHFNFSEECVSFRDMFSFQFNQSSNNGSLRFVLYEENRCIPTQEMYAHFFNLSICHHVAIKNGSIDASMSVSCSTVNISSWY
eukprot:UN05318